jgi:hypothetical protein
VSRAGLHVGATVLHQRRGPDDRVVVERYTVRGLQGSQAVLAQPGSRQLTRVAADTVLRSPAWAIQERLW